MPYVSTFFNGLALCAGLIVAIGSQNAHVLRTGLKREHVGLTVAACILIDAVLIGLGVAGVGTAVQSSPLLLGAARWGGAAFLLWYGLRSWRAVFASAALTVAPEAARIGARQALAKVVALSLLNPHVYLDTVVLLGAIGGNFTPPERTAFALGAMSASALWFCALGYGATRLSGLFARPAAWKWIDGLTGSMMLALSASVAFGS
ncbi:LysE/ArgO family amino acid transporter [Massilia sp. P8910]|uniref:LysE/ArgO family amino acid transporter n=1 Tax=Massilia antarctica TaxID=2765360 RepID=UPI001E4D35FB|nr:LysE/ArgO family amino acid transporter [Massilia antarctica]MCE3606507.1 LysE/ArgO family amino acid transporter [Massilia antarctica]